MVVDVHAQSIKQPHPQRKTSSSVPSMFPRTPRLEHGMVWRKDLPICVRLIKELHDKLMTDVRGHHAMRGEFRKIQNWIGKPGSTAETASFVPPPPDEVEPCLAAWEKFLHESDLPPLVTIALAHYQFEAIHPFLDGNGRV